MALTTADDPRVASYQGKPGCIEGNELCFPWDSGEICWDDNPFCWDETCILIAEEIVEAVVSGKVIGTAEGWHKAYDELEDKKKKKFIELVAIVKGEEIKQRKEVKDVKLKAEDIQLTVETILNIKVNVER